MTRPYTVQDLKLGHVYRLDSRNLSYGIWDGEDGFIGIRTKFGSRFLDKEIHWDLDSHYGTARPLEDLGFLTEDVWYISTYTLDKDTQRKIKFDYPVLEGGKGWYFTDTGESCMKATPICVSNDVLFQQLDEFIKDKV